MAGALAGTSEWSHGGLTATEDDATYRRWFRLMEMIAIRAD
jgi:hypothetical protein